MNEHEFLLQLQQRAKEQQKLMHDVPFPRVFTLVSEWLGNHPWRFLIPLAFLLTFLLHDLFGKSYDEFILSIFGGL